MHSQNLERFTEVFKQLSESVKYFNFGLDYLDM